MGDELRASMFAEDLDESIKIIVVGNGAVGKTSMITRFCKGELVADYKKTIAVDFVEKKDYEVDGVSDPVTMHVWDTAGQEEYDAVTKKYYRGANGCILAFSTVDAASFKAVEKWKAKVEEHCDNIPMVIVQNKIDLLQEAAVNQTDAEALAKKLNLKLFRTSVKENQGVDAAFQALAVGWHVQKTQRAVTDATASQSSGTKPGDKVDLGQPKKRGEEKKKGCQC